MHDIIHVQPNDVQRLGLERMLRGTGFRVAVSIGNAGERMNSMANTAQRTLAMENYPDAIILTEIVFGSESEMDLTPLIDARRAGMRSVVFSESEDPDHILCAREEGALDYIFFSESREMLVARLSRAAQEGTQGGCFAGKLQLPSVKLTPRETEVVKKLALGLSNKEIGQVLGISYETAKEHVQHILRKLGLGDRCQAAVWWVRKELKKQTA